MKVKKFVLIVLLLSFYFSYSQVTNEGNPKSWDLNLSTDIEEKILPPFDIQSLRMKIPRTKERVESHGDLVILIPLIMVLMMASGLFWKMVIEYGGF